MTKPSKIGMFINKLQNKNIQQSKIQKLKLKLKLKRKLNAKSSKTSQISQ